tara:strand:+ start:531 stop:1298 length:768 start_codon:yes stop_codon:yes gene_type:complete
MAFKMKGINFGEGTSSAMKKVDPTDKILKSEDVQDVKLSKNIKWQDRPYVSQLGEKLVGKNPTEGRAKYNLSEEELAAGGGSASDFYGTEKKTTGKRWKRKNTSDPKINPLTGFARSDRHGKTKTRKRFIKEDVVKDKNKAKKNIFTGKRSRKIDSIGKQERLYGKENKYGNPLTETYKFTGLDKKGKEVKKWAKRKAVFNPKTGELEEKVRRKSGIGYKRTGRKIKDQQYINSARVSEIIRKEEKRGTGLENVS